MKSTFGMKIWILQEIATKFGAKSEILNIFISLSDFLWLHYTGIMHNFILIWILSCNWSNSLM